MLELEPTCEHCNIEGHADCSMSIEQSMVPPKAFAMAGR